ncbi:hypothetical protein BYT27DRAFT_7338981 [Phlegmacium glaucopus]|nr:hypothetical protein BYT27DRAFT_7338981 [Phlegmacium glaucopus]
MSFYLPIAPPKYPNIVPSWTLLGLWVDVNIPNNFHTDKWNARPTSPFQIDCLIKSICPSPVLLKPFGLAVSSLTDDAPEFVAGASKVELASSVSTETNHSSSTSGQVLTQEDVASCALLKAEGKKRAIDEDEDATATEGESSIIEGPLKKKKRQNKCGIRTP